jgi:hypothetical protein
VTGEQATPCEKNGAYDLIAIQTKADWDTSSITMDPRLPPDCCSQRAHQQQAEESHGIDGYQTTPAQSSTTTLFPEQSVTTTRSTVILDPSTGHSQTSCTKSMLSLQTASLSMLPRTRTRFTRTGRAITRSIPCGLVPTILEAMPS